MSASLQDAIRAIKRLTGQSQTLSVPKAFVESFGEWPMAVFFSQLLYWSGVVGDENGGWFYKSYQDWQEEILLTERQLRRCSEDLQKMGLIIVEVRKVNGAPTLHWRVDDEAFGEWFKHLPLESGSVKRSNESLRKVRINPDEREESILTSSQNPPYEITNILPSPTTGDENEATSFRQTKGQNENLGKTAEVDQRPQSKQDVLTALDQLRRSSPAGRLKGPDLKLFQEKLPGLLERYEADEVLAAFEAFLDDPYWKEKKSPSHAFISQLASYVSRFPQSSNGGSKARSPALAPPLPAITHAEVEAVASTGLASPVNGVSAIALPFPALEWNRVVTAGEPVEDWTKRDRTLEAAVNDPDFLAALPKILERCQKAHKAQGDEADWLTFRWLLKRKRPEDPENWYRVVTGDMAWAGHKRERKTTAADRAKQAIAEVLGEEAAP